jgi:mono/diheme cytochrome c family protein
MLVKKADVNNGYSLFALPAGRQATGRHVTLILKFLHMNKIIRQVSKMKLPGFIVIGTITGAITFLLAFAPIPQSKDWEVPDLAKNKKNPIPAKDASIDAGKIIYTKSCYDCHGKKGKGDGPKSADLPKSPQDFSKESFQKQTDGTLFWKISEGRKPMPTFKKDLSEDQRWQVINYVRTLGMKK